jgi:hypothetical protein
MHIVIGLFFIAYGIAHLVGFVTPWRLMTIEDMPYKTTLLSGALDVGDVGIRLMGILWLIAALAFAAAGFGLIFVQSWWQPLTLYASIYSLVLSVLGWPDSRFGVLINILILAYLLFGDRLDWLPQVGEYRRETLTLDHSHLKYTYKLILILKEGS